MLIIDDILTFPFKSLLWIFKEIGNAAEQEMASETEAITEELRQLYMMLETGMIDEDEFDEREQVLLDRLDALQEEADAHSSENGEEEDDDDDDDDEEEDEEEDEDEDEDEEEDEDEDEDEDEEEDDEGTIARRGTDRPHSE